MRWAVIGATCGLVTALAFVFSSRDYDDYEIADTIIGMAVIGITVGAVIGLLVGAARAMRRGSRRPPPGTFTTGS